MPIGFLVLGLCAGILAGMLGIGGGALIVPILVLVFGFEMHMAVGTSLAVIIPTAVASALTHYGFANVRPEAAIIIAIGAVAGGITGAWIAEAVPGELLSRIFGVFLLAISIKMITGI